MRQRSRRIEVDLVTTRELLDALDVARADKGRDAEPAIRSFHGPTRPDEASDARRARLRGERFPHLRGRADRAREAALRGRRRVVPFFDGRRIRFRDDLPCDRARSRFQPERSARLPRWSVPSDGGPHGTETHRRGVRSPSNVGWTLRWERSSRARAYGAVARQEARRPVKQFRALVIALATLWPPLALADDSAHVTIRGGWAGPGVGAN